MSVKVATPTKEDMFKSMGEVPDPLLERKTKSVPNKMDTVIMPAATECKDNSDKQTLTDSRQNVQVSVIKKRRSSERGNFNMRYQTRKRSFRQDKSKHGKDVIKLPTKFLLGGNINDPLNLNSMNDEEINRIVNAQTPVSSPLPTPAHRLNVEVLIPPNINDPLNLNSGEELNPEMYARQFGKKRKKHKRKKSIVGDNNDNVICKPEEGKGKDFSEPLSVDTGDTSGNKTVRDITSSLSSKLKKVVDKIVSPAIPQHSPKPKRKRTISEVSKKMENDGVTQTKQARKEREQQNKMRKQSSNSSVRGKMNFRNRDDKFIYGNYDRYYGKRNPQDEDDRLNHLQKELFYEKDVLDIGCNIGHITLSIAKNYEPNKIVGMDIDGQLINVARKNVKHYISQEQLAGKKVPVSLPQTFGPVATTNIPEKNTRLTFPNNICFVQGNYVFERDELLELQKEEYDVILALSITKWLHLNFGDGGLKRSFQRMHRQLRPGGKLILEPQSFPSYKKKKNLNENIFENYQAIRFTPDQFTRYLMSAEVGFVKFERIETPFNKSQGFQRPIFVFTKADSNYTTPHPVTESRGVTPLMNIDCGHNFTPAFDSYAATSSYDANSIDIDYSITPSRQFTPQWDSVPSGVMFAVGTPLYSGFVGTPSQLSDLDQAAAPSRHDTAPSSAKSTPGHMTPSHMIPSGHVTPCHATPSGSQSSSSSCDTCCSASSDSSCQASELTVNESMADNERDERLKDAGSSPAIEIKDDGLVEEGG